MLSSWVSFYKGSQFTWGADNRIPSETDSHDIKGIYVSDKIKCDLAKMVYTALRNRISDTVTLVNVKFTQLEVP